MRDLSPEMLNGMILGLNYYQDIDTPVNRSFVERYVKAHKTVPSYAAAYGYDSMRTLFMAMEKAKSLEVEAVIKRSEEHTSELQSLMRSSYAVFCLKKKIIKKAR